METATLRFYERRKQSSLIDFNDRRMTERRKQDLTCSLDLRRLASQVRRYERNGFKIPVRLQIDGKEISGHTQNISSEGLLIFSDIALNPGTPMDLHFSFKEGVSFLKLSGRVVFCRFVEQDGSSQRALGINFSGIRDVEQMVLASAVRTYKDKNMPHDASLLSIDIFKDTLAQEAGSLSMPSLRPVEVEPASNLLIKSLGIDRRFSPRIDTNLSIELFPYKIKANMIDLGETGVCFESEIPTQAEEVFLSIDLSPRHPEQPVKLSAKILWSRKSAGDKTHYGARFSAFNEKSVTKIKEFVFDAYAKKASGHIRNNEELKIKVEDFFNKDVKQYHDSLSALTLELDHRKMKSVEIEKELATLTNNLLLKGDALERIDARSIRKVKEVFRELVGCWVYKSPIMKMGFDKPRGYPGDYDIFEIIYRNQPIAEGIGYYFDQYFLNNNYTLAVRKRKDKMKAILKDFIESSSLPCVKLLSIACGPSQEVRELFAEPILLNGKKVVFTGLDHDPGALDLSSAALKNLPPNVEARFLEESVLNLIRGERYYDVVGKQDIIYILGLSEYLPDRIFKKLFSFLYKLLNDNGVLVITSKDKNIHFPTVPPDWFCEWTFGNRTEDDLINIAKGQGAGDYSLKVERESSGTIIFLTLTKT